MREDIYERLQIDHDTPEYSLDLEVISFSVERLFWFQ